MATVTTEALNLLEGTANGLKRDKVEFHCFYCPAKFKQFKELVDHYRDEHLRVRRSDKK